MVYSLRSLALSASGGRALSLSWDSGEPGPLLRPPPPSPCPHVSSGGSYCPSGLAFTVTVPLTPCGGRWPEPATWHPWFFRPQFHLLECGSCESGATYSVSYPVVNGRGAVMRSRDSDSERNRKWRKAWGRSDDSEEDCEELARDSDMKENIPSVAGGERREV